jgi:uncharacterized protein (TIGR02145 family)
MAEVYEYKGFTGVKIGEQFWMNNNLDVGKGIKDPDHPEFGKYYTWYQAIKSVPEGWRLPSLEDWKELEKSSKNNINSLKSKNGWSDFVLEDDAADTFYGNGNDLFNFNAIPTSEYYITLNRFIFDYDNNIIRWWSSSEKDNKFAYLIALGSYIIEFGKVPVIKNGYYNVRCVQDWDIVKDYINQNRDIDNIELDNLDDLNESMKFFKQTERLL